MNHIDDPRLVFYLRNEKLIDEWAAVKDDVRHVVIRFYESIAEDLEAVVETMDDDVAVVRGDSAYGYVGIARSEWFALDEPRVAIIFEWHRKSASFTSGHRVAGVRVELKTDGGKDLFAAIRDNVKVKANAGRFRSSTNYWPAFTAVDGGEGVDFWEDLQPFREHIVELVTAAWDEFAEDVTKAVSGESDSGEPQPRTA